MDDVFVIGLGLIKKLMFIKLYILSGRDHKFKANWGERSEVRTNLSKTQQDFQCQLCVEVIDAERELF
jgi:hypothetical protein